MPGPPSAASAAANGWSSSRGHDDGKWRGSASWNQGEEDPWAAGDPWGGAADSKSAPSNGSAATHTEHRAAWSERFGGHADSAPAAAVKPGSDFDGTYKDDWGGEEIVLSVDSNGSVTANWPSGSWKTEYGTLKNGRLDLISMTADVADGVLSWSNGSSWTKQQAAASAAEAAPAAEGGDADARHDAWNAASTETWQQKPADPWQEKQEPANAWSSASADAWQQQESSDPWGGAGASPQQEGTAWQATATAGGSSSSWAADAAAASPWDAKPADGVDDAWGAAAAGRAGQGTEEDAQKKARVKNFDEWQAHYKAKGILPGKHDWEHDADESRLFGGEEAQQTEGCDFDLYSHVSCDITGPNSDGIPKFDTFDEIFEAWVDFIPGELINNVRKCGYKHPTPVQKYAIPAAIIGRDVMVTAQTGSGKTAAFLIPTLAGMMKHKKATGALTEPYEGPCKPDTLILSPTRELCLQIYREAEKFFHRTQHRVVRVYGQEDAKVQIEQIAKGTDLCVATPGRLWDFVNSGIMEVTEVQTLVLDEADRMLQMQMDSFLKDIIENFGMPSQENRQTMMFSATFPEECQKMATAYLYEYIYVGVGVVGGASCCVQQRLIQVAPEDKFDKLVGFIDDFLDTRNEGERLLVFTNSKLQAKGLDEKLWDHKVDTGALHGDLRQDERETNLMKFRKGEIDVMIATDVASRGLDISGVSQVLNYDLPHSIDVYVQRIGRTGRIGHRGVATTFVAVDKAGTWHDYTQGQTDTILALPQKMENPGTDNQIPDWLLQKVDELKAGTWQTGARGENGAAAAAAPAAEGWDAWNQVAQGNSSASAAAPQASGDAGADQHQHWEPWGQGADGTNGASAAAAPQASSEAATDQRWDSWQQADDAKAGVWEAAANENNSAPSAGAWEAWDQVKQADDRSGADQAPQYDSWGQQGSNERWE